MYELDYGHLLNKAGKFNYCKEESVGNLIRYIARDREQEDKRGELLVILGLHVYVISGEACLAVM